jgi:hypothetical protein
LGKGYNLRALLRAGGHPESSEISLIFLLVRFFGRIAPSE